MTMMKADFIALADVVAAIGDPKQRMATCRMMVEKCRMRSKRFDESKFREACGCVVEIYGFG